MWGLPDKRGKTSAPKSFSIASKVQRSSVEQSLTCRVHPVAILKILDAYVRRPEGAKRTIGTLLGWISEGSVLDITDSFPVVHKDQDEGNVLMDQEYHKTMLALRQKVSPREVVVGWFSTGNEIEQSAASITGYYCSKESSFTPTAVMPGPIHLLVDTGPNTTLGASSQDLGIKAYVHVRTTVAESLLQFHEVPLRVQTSAAEKSGIAQLMAARRSAREAASQGQDAPGMESLDGFEAGLKELLASFRRMQEYVRAVKDDKVEGDLAVGRGLTTALCAEPVIDMEAVEGLCQNSLQDALMVVYLSNLTRTQISIAEKINAVYGMAGDGR